MATHTILHFTTNVTLLQSSSSSISTGCLLSPFFLKGCDSPRARPWRRAVVCCSFTSMESAKINVVGVGSGGNNAVTRMIGSRLQDLLRELSLLVPMSVVGAGVRYDNPE